MRRVVVVGSPGWSDSRTAIAALRRVMDVYREPYTLVCDMTDGAARYAAAAARMLGWRVEPHEFDQSKCLPDCPTVNHRRRGGPTGDFCPAARGRNTAAMLDSNPDLCIALLRSGGGRATHDGARAGQAGARARGIAVWQYQQRKGQDGGDEAS